MSAPLKMDFSPWPVLQRIAEAVGSAATLTLAARYGGRMLYIPQAESIGESHILALELGLATARRLAREVGHGHIMIPLGPTSSVERRKLLIRQMGGEGMTNSQVAAALGIHRRTVELRRQTDRRAGLLRDDTGDLFED
jgi:hypothetical protein